MHNETSASLEEVILKAMELPVLPATSQKVLTLMGDPDVSIEKIKRLISTDPGLTAKLLKISNSAFYGGYRDIQNLSQAILRLGLNSVRNIVVATSLKNVYKRFGLTEKLLWEQMIGSAMASNIIASRTRKADAEDAFIAGLLHDVGKVVLNNEYPEKFAQVMEGVYNYSKSFEEAESENFEFTHREVGAMVVKKWCFPESLEMLLRHFDNHDAISKDRQLYNLVTIVTMSDRLCQKFGMGWREPAGEAVELDQLAEVLELDTEASAEIEELAQAAFKQGKEMY